MGAGRALGNGRGRWGADWGGGTVRGGGGGRKCRMGQVSGEGEGQGCGAGETAECGRGQGRVNRAVQLRDHRACEWLSGTLTTNTKPKTMRFSNCEFVFLRNCTTRSKQTIIALPAHTTSCFEFLFLQTVNFRPTGQIFQTPTTNSLKENAVFDFLFFSTSVGKTHDSI